MNSMMLNKFHYCQMIVVRCKHVLYNYTFLIKHSKEQTDSVFVLTGEWWNWSPNFPSTVTNCHQLSPWWVRRFTKAPEVLQEERQAFH